MSEKVQIGDATLYCGDCLDILPTLGHADFVITDPPYNVGYKYDNYDDKLDEGIYLNWLLSIFIRCAADNLIWFWQGIRVARGEVMKVLPATHRVHHLAAWYRKEFAGDVAAKGHPMYCWEPIIWATRLEKPVFSGPIGGHQGRDMLLGNSSRHDKLASGHPCPKTESVVSSVVAWTDGVVLDPFMGSGTTGAACAKQGRKFIGIEIDKKYFDIACERIDREYAQGKLF